MYQLNTGQPLSINCNTSDIRSTQNTFTNSMYQLKSLLFAKNAGHGHY